MHFKAIPTPKSRTLKQNAQEAQTPTEASVTTVITTAATTAIITAATTAIITAATTAATITTKKAKGKAKGRVLPLERWYKRLGHLNYADVKQLATHNS
jgi:hypothetical protein